MFYKSLLVKPICKKTRMCCINVKKIIVPMVMIMIMMLDKEWKKIKAS